MSIKISGVGKRFGDFVALGTSTWTSRPAS